AGETFDARLGSKVRDLLKGTDELGAAVRVAGIVHGVDPDVDVAGLGDLGKGGGAGQEDEVAGGDVGGGDAAGGGWAVLGDLDVRIGGGVPSAVEVGDAGAGGRRAGARQACEERHDVGVGGHVPVAVEVGRAAALLHRQRRRQRRRVAARGEDIE